MSGSDFLHKLLSKGPCDADTIQRAESLLDELRPESPLRFRLQEEIDELRERLDSDVA
jgi:hypothetical protein